LLFDPNPKSRREDLFGRDEEINMFTESLELGERLIVVYGVRRVGKTSFIRVALRELKYPHVIIDVREIYNTYGRVTKYHLYSKMAEYFTRNLDFFGKMGFKLRELLRRIRGFRVTELGVDIEPVSLPSITSLLRRYDEWASKHNTRFVIAFDEAQYLRFSGVTRYDGIFAWAVDNLENLTIVVTGSEIGILQDFLRLDDPKAPLFGRYAREIKLERFTRTQSIEFLKKGFSELNIAIDENELHEVTSRLDGIPGWLTLYGYYRGVEKRSHIDALEKVFEVGSKLTMEELEKIVAPSRERYLTILEAITRGASTWREIKTYVMYKTGPITDKRFTDLLKKLVKYSIIEKRDNQYKIADPLIEYSIKIMISHT